jgi:hypothetical protein
MVSKVDLDYCAVLGLGKRLKVPDTIDVKKAQELKVKM